MAVNYSNELWLVSAPQEETVQQMWENRNNATDKQNTHNSKFTIPDLKVRIGAYAVL